MTAQAQENQTPPTEHQKTVETNLANMRKALEAERAEKELIKKKIEELEKQAKQKAQPVSSADDEDSDEPYVDQRFLQKKLSKFEESIDQKIAKAAEEKARQIVEEQNRIAYLKQNSDFEQTMQPEVVQKFAEKFPGMAESILRMPDGFERQKLVYEAIKGTGINKKEESKVQDTINQNRRSPFQPVSGGTPPYAMQGDFSAAGQKKSFEQMRELQKRLRLG